MHTTRDEILECVKASPARVADHDKQAWLNLFSASAVVEDPVGSAPNRKGEDVRDGQDQLGRFYETFIAPNRIRFEVTEDIVCGMEVVRDVLIHTTLSTGLEVAVPVHLRYRVGRRGDTLEIEHLAAHWELVKMSTQTLSQGWKGLVTMPLMSWHMMRTQGLGWMWGYSQAMFRGIFGRGKRTARDFAVAVNAGDVSALAALFDGDPAAIEYPVGTALDAAGLLTKIGQAAKFEISHETSAGWNTSFRVRITGEAGEQHGLAFLHFDSASKRIRSARFFVQDD